MSGHVYVLGFSSSLMVWYVLFFIVSLLNSVSAAFQFCNHEENNN